MNAVYNVSRAVQDKSAFSELVSAISALETQDKQEELKEVPTIKTDEQQSSAHDDFMQAFNTLLKRIASGK